MARSLTSSEGFAAGPRSCPWVCAAYPRLRVVAAFFPAAGFALPPTAPGVAFFSFGFRPDGPASVPDSIPCSASSGGIFCFNFKWIYLAFTLFFRDVQRAFISCERRFRIAALIGFRAVNFLETVVAFLGPRSSRRPSSHTSSRPSPALLRGPVGSGIRLQTGGDKGEVLQE
jgi:hypothetical protein